MMGPAAALAAAFFAGAVAMPLMAQSAAIGNLPAFDIASVKANKSDSQPTSNFPLGPGDVYVANGGYFTATNMPLVTYIFFAYKIMNNERQYLLPQLPEWVTSDRFDIQARAQGNPGKDQMRLMMRSLLADRFKLATHYETRQVPVSALVLAKPGSLGPHLRPHPADSPCPTTPSESQSGDREFPALCGGLFEMPASAAGSRRVGARNVTIEFIANTLMGTTDLGRPVVNQTGLSGTLDFNLEWTPDLANTPPTDGNTRPEVPPGPSFQEALRVQLGLKLESKKGSISMIVLDHVEHPSEN